MRTVSRSTQEEHAHTGWEAAKEARLDHDEEWAKRLKKAMHYAKGPPLELDDFERAELALMVPGVDKDSEGSWKDLTKDQLDSLISMLEGWVFITYLLGQREEPEDDQ